MITLCMLGLEGRGSFQYRNERWLVTKGVFEMCVKPVCTKITVRTEFTNVKAEIRRSWNTKV